MSAGASDEVWRVRQLLGHLEDTYLAIGAVQAAFDLGVFECLADRGRPVESLAGVLAASVRGTAALTDALCSLGLLRKEGATIELSAAGRAYLDPASPTYYGGSLRRVTLSAGAMGSLSRAVRTGQALGHTDEPGAGALWAQDVAPSLLNWPHEVQAAQRVWPDLVPVSDAWRTLVDLGCGSGTRVFALLDLVDSATVTSVDWFEEVLDVAGRVAAAMGLSNRVTTHRADLREVDFAPASVDLVHASSVLYFYPLATQEQLLRKVRTWLRPGGYLVSRHLMATNDRTGSREALTRALQMFLYHPEGYLPTEAEARSCALAAGFEDVRIVDGTFLVGRRPALRIGD